MKMLDSGHFIFFYQMYIYLCRMFIILHGYWCSCLFQIFMLVGGVMKQNPGVDQVFSNFVNIPTHQKI